MMGSPWLEEYERRRPVRTLESDVAADVAVVGGGISGLLTAYELLEGTSRSVAVVERGLVGHGATGHNGGQVVGAFERRHEDLVADLGRERVEQGYREMSEAWEALGRMLADLGEPRLRMVPAHLGLAVRRELDQWVSELRTRGQLGLSGGTLRVADDVPSPPEEAEVVTRSEIDRLMWSRGRRFLASVEMEVGLLNSYALCEQIALAMLERHPSRFTVWERSPVESVEVRGGAPSVRAGGWTVRAENIILCTNGYRTPTINTSSGPREDARTRGVIGYMVGMTSATGHAGARAYFTGGEEPYFYLTRREHDDAWLTAVGGPEEPVRGELEAEGGFDAFRRIDEFIEGTLAVRAGLRDHHWLGLMGYTPTGVRAAGRDPTVPRLWYNLGCNGIGLLSAVVGARRLAALLDGRAIAPSMFDPEAALSLGTERSVQRAW